MATKGDKLLAQAALVRVRALTDTSKESMCGVPDEHKEGVRIYVESWIEPVLAALVAHLEDGVPIEHWMVEDARRVAMRDRYRSNGHGEG